MRNAFHGIDRQLRFRPLAPRSAWAGATAVALTAAWLLPVGEAAAEATPLSGNALKETVTGKTIDLDTPFGTKITINYRDNGSMSGTADAALSIYLGASTDRGRWWVENGRLCQKFFKWLEAETSCLRLRMDGRHIAWTRDDGKTGTAMIVASGPVHAGSAYGLGGGGLAMAPVPAPVLAPIQPVVPSDEPPQHQTDQQAAPHQAETPHIAPATPRPILASLTPAAAIVPPTPELVTRPSSPPLAFRLPADWTADIDQSADLGTLVTQTRMAHARHRWCHEVRDIRLLMRPQAVDAEAPELMTAARHLQSPETSDIPPASCLVPSPAMQEVARNLLHSSP